MARPNRPRDTNRLAKFIVDVATGEVEAEVEAPPVNEFARAGGLKGGKARAEKLTPEQRSEIARKGAKARWGKPTHSDTHILLLNLGNRAAIIGGMICRSHLNKAFEKSWPRMTVKPRFLRAAHDAWTAYLLHEDRGWYRRKTTGAHIVWEHWVAGLIDVFSDDPGVFVLEHHDTISFIFDDSVLARAKRADRSLRTSNAQTELSDLFHDHGEDLFEYTGLQRVELVYVPDRFAKHPDWVGVVSRDGDAAYGILN